MDKLATKKAHEEARRAYEERRREIRRARAVGEADWEDEAALLELAKKVRKAEQQLREANTTALGRALGEGEGESVGIVDVRDTVRTGIRVRDEDGGSQCLR